MILLVEEVSGLQRAAYTEIWPCAAGLPLEVYLTRELLRADQLSQTRHVGCQRVLQVRGARQINGPGRGHPRHRRMQVKALDLEALLRGRKMDSRRVEHDRSHMGRLDLQVYF